ncbi:hypothetical protein BCE75_101283 [Isoptericola sp. CG 20/1183]|uniref:DoxX-like protein n=1 Tax=Isoptericola halotolerans TaxID=300560 RepID=A0ABX5EJ11_9MICO|nr:MULTISPECIES: hypothetical protein [Isoptericola]PRZ08597.1 hypothetical protein BCL65_102139 [Isoptericola halotolerans]PRZ10956.1 hypothetical protein BCE75_101283 [Isoptericola sp. CG 20/1183]
MKIGVGGSIGPLRGGVSNRGAGIGVGPFSVAASNRDMQGFVVFLVGAALVGAVAVGPYFLGKWVAGLCGAAPDSTARFVTGWIFEGVYLAVIALVLTVLFTQAVARVVVAAVGVWLAPFATGGHLRLASVDDDFWIVALLVVLLAVGMNFFTLGAVIRVEGALPLALVSLFLNSFLLYCVEASTAPDGSAWDAGRFGWVVLVAALIAVGQALASAAIAHLQE